MTPEEIQADARVIAHSDLDKPTGGARRTTEIVKLVERAIADERKRIMAEVTKMFS